MDPWLTAAADALAREAGVSRGLLELDDAAATTLLELAATAAHDTGARTNAPLLCYLVGLCAGRSGRTLDELAATVDDAAA
jgi:hypothetical protein